MMVKDLEDCKKKCFQLYEKNDYFLPKDFACDWVCEAVMVAKIIRQVKNEKEEIR